MLVLAGPSHLEKNSFTARHVRPSQQVVEKAPSTAMPPHCAPSALQSAIAQFNRSPTKKRVARSQRDERWTRTFGRVDAERAGVEAERAGVDAERAILLFYHYGAVASDELAWQTEQCERLGLKGRLRLRVRASTAR